MNATSILIFAAVTLASGTIAAAADESDVRGEIQGYLEAWNSGDAERLASFYMEDGDRANNRGDVFRGREAISDHYRRVFAAPPPEGIERTLVYEDVKVRIVAADAAVVDVRYRVSGISPEIDRSVRGRNTVFMIRQGGRWMRAAHRNSLPISPKCLNVCSDRNLLPWGRRE